MPPPTRSAATISRTTGDQPVVGSAPAPLVSLTPSTDGVADSLLGDDVSTVPDTSTLGVGLADSLALGLTLGVTLTDGVGLVAGRQVFESTK